MKCNSTKCRAVHSGTNNMNFCLKLGPHHLEMTEQERNLFLLICHRGMVSCQHRTALRKANVLVPGNVFPLRMGQYLCHVPAQVQPCPGGHPTTPAEEQGMEAQKGAKWPQRKGLDGVIGKSSGQGTRGCSEGKGNTQRRKRKLFELKD